MLIESGIDFDSQNQDGRTALMLAAQMGDEQLVDYLLDIGCDKTISDASGKTAYELALTSSNPKCSDVIKLDRPVKPNPSKLVRAVNNMQASVTTTNKSPDTSVSEAAQQQHRPSSAAAMKKFENLFAVKKEVEIEMNNKKNKRHYQYEYEQDEVDDEDVIEYEEKSQDLASKILQNSKKSKLDNSQPKSEVLDSWLDSDEDEDDDLDAIPTIQRVILKWHKSHLFPFSKLLDFVF
jgi:ankyrin repeat protein